jgi:hypothetical protein
MEEAMTAPRSLVVISILCWAPAAAVLAQADRTGIGGGPLSTEKAPNTTVVGQTKPPSRDASPTSVKPIERLTPRQAADDKITTRICIGCGPDPSTTGTLAEKPIADRTPAKSDTQLDSLSYAAKPEKQADLDTFALASAHRERAESVQEKTNGLWQSWLVSVCAGCGDQKPARSWRYEEWPIRNGLTTTGAIDRKVPLKAAPPAEVKRTAAHHHGALEADLSPENVGSIRRMPQW